jgi:hypothetical protein
MGSLYSELHQEYNENKFSPPVFPVATSHVNDCYYVSYILAILSFSVLNGLFILMER